MSRKLILGIALLVLLCVMLAAPMHEAMERNHTPFPIDGDFGTMMVTMFVGLCTGMAAVTVPWLALALALAALVPGLVCSRASAWHRSMTPQKLLYSPPGHPFSLRI